MSRPPSDWNPQSNGGAGRGGLNLDSTIEIPCPFPDTAQTVSVVIAGNFESPAIVRHL